MPENDNHSFATPKILHDWPLPEGRDAQFKFTEYAITLSRLIADKTTATPLTLGISGAWGTGKTTLLQRLKAMLDETRILLERERPEKLSFVGPDEKPSDYRVCRTVWFNAWKYADESQLLVALVRVITQEMFKDDFISKGAATLLEPFTPRRDVINTVLGWFSIKVGEATAGVNTGTAVETPFAKNMALLDLFDDVFDRLLAAWVHRSLTVEKIEPTNGVLVVFIDDLDRCLPAKMVQVLEAIKLFMDKRGCVFVLGADREIIQQAVEKQYEGAGVRGQTASDYLEKVIQLRFHLPPIPESEMDAFVHRQIEDEVLKAHWRIVALGAEANLRKVKTFLNDLQLQWAVWQNTGQARGVNFDDFVRWEVLMRSAPAFRRRMYGIYDPEMRARLLGSAFEWALGKEEAAASFKADLNEQIQRVLKDVEQYKAHFDPELITKLVFLVAPVEPEKTVVTLEAALDLKLESAGVVAKGVTRGAVGRTSSPTYDDKRMTIGGIEFVKIPKGRFLMGSKDDNKLASDDEKPQHTVEITQDYWLARFPLTNRSFAEFVKAANYQTAAEKQGSAYALDGAQWNNTKGANWQHPRGPQSDLAKKEAHPVVSVTWDDAQAYCQWFNQQHRAELGSLTLRLPTEAEWEKAARGEYGNEWPWGHAEPDEKRCNFNMHVKDTTPAGQYSPQGDSPYGCADMAGNVWEWCQDWYDQTEYKNRTGKIVVDPSGPNKGSSRVVRGGSFRASSRDARCPSRDYPDYPYGNLGLRVVAVPMVS